MSEFWTKEKLGKHPKLAETAASLYKQYALCEPDKLLARLKESKLKLGNVGPIDWNNLLSVANLDDCLKQEYVKAALDVKTSEPAIGKGEFILVSLFDNIGFAKDHGDLIDLNTKKRAEVKGVSSAICNGHSSNYRELTPDLLRAIFGNFRLTAPGGLDERACRELEQFVIRDERKLYYVLDAFRNTTQSRRPTLESAVANFKTRNTHSLFTTIAGMHLYDFLKTENASYLIAVNKDHFMCFNAPANVYQAVDILSYFSIDGWRVGKRGMTVTLK